MEEQPAFRQANAGHPHTDFHAEIWQLERPIYDPEIQGQISRRWFHGEKYTIEALLRPTRRISALRPKATELVRNNKQSRCAMSGHSRLRDNAVRLPPTAQIGAYRRPLAALVYMHYL